MCCSLCVSDVEEASVHFHFTDEDTEAKRGQTSLNFTHETSEALPSSPAGLSGVPKTSPKPGDLVP
jgi:hypothetical protein